MSIRDRAYPWLNLAVVAGIIWAGGKHGPAAVPCDAQAGQMLAAQPSLTITVPTGETLTLDSRIEVQTLTVMHGGELILEPGAEIVIADRPFEAGDSEQLGNGIVVMGKITANGTPKTAYVQPSGGTTKGSRTLTVPDAPEGWNPGDVLCLADVRQHDYDGRTGTHTEPAINSEKNTESRTRSWCRRPDEWHHETAVIESVDGGTITLAEPLRYDHINAKGECCRVANLTRDIVLRSESPNGIRGHLIVMHGGVADLTGVEIRDFGRTTVDVIGDSNVNGRYGLHFHHAAQGQRVENCAINGSPKWGIVLHGTSYSQVLDCVVWQAAGAGYVHEDGNEVGNVLLGNYAGACTGSGEKIDIRQKGATDKGHEGTGFWWRGTHQMVAEGNVAEGCYHSGFAVFQFPPPSALSIDMVTPGGDEVSSRNLKSYCQAASIAHNEAAGTQRGFEFWNHNQPITYHDLHAYGCSEVGIATFYVDHLDLQNSSVQNDPLLLSGVGIAHEGTEGAGNMTLANVTATGCAKGVRLVPNDGLSTIDGCRLLGNAIDLERRNSKAEGDVRVEITNTDFDSYHLDWRGRWHWKVETILRLDQTFIDGRQVFFAEQAADWGPIPETVVKERPGKLPLIQFEGAPQAGMTNADMIEAGLPPVAGEVAWP